MTSMTFLLFEMRGKLYFLQIYHSSLHFKSIYDSVTRLERSTTNVFLHFRVPTFGSENDQVNGN
jgi:hypothetical protein